MTKKFLGLSLILLLAACGASVAEPFEPIFGNTDAGTQVGDCISWPNLSVKVVEGEYDWSLHAFNGSGCNTQVQIFEQVYEMDSRFAGLWQELFLVDSGTSMDHELYLINSESGERLASLWYVEKPIFSEKKIRFFEPTEDKADVSLCPQPKDVLAQWQEWGMPVMYTVEKIFDRKTGSVSAGEKVGCYALQ